jgi:N-acetylglucosaminyl-diphospho-decaprenol L-rhamnosyltransferase
MSENFDKVISFIIVNYNVKKYLVQCINSIRDIMSHSNNSYEIIVVDNGSLDGSREYFSKISDIEYLYQNQNHGFGKANNIGVSASKGEYLIFVNPDLVLTKLTDVDHLIRILQNDKRIGILSTMIRFPDGNIQTIGEKFPNVLNTALSSLLFWDYRIFKDFRFRRYKQRGLFSINWVTGAFFLTPKSIYNEMKGFDEKIFLNAEDIDLAARMRKNGYAVKVYDRCSVVHYYGKSKSKSGFSSDVSRYFRNQSGYKYVIKKNNLSYFPTILVILKTINYILRYNILVLRRWVSCSK